MVIAFRSFISANACNTHTHTHQLINIIQLLQYWSLSISDLNSIVSGGALSNVKVKKTLNMAAMQLFYDWEYAFGNYT